MKRDSISNIVFSAPERNESVLSPAAQSTKLLHVSPTLAKEHDKVVGLLNNDPDIPGYLKAGLYLMYASGLRVSELLNIRSEDLRPYQYIRIRGLKNSKDRYVYPPTEAGLWFRDRLYMPNLLSQISRFYMYRLFKRHGLYFKNEGKGHDSVTHYFRVLYIRTLEAYGADNNEIMQAIGHKNVNSQQYYKNEAKKGV